MFAKRADIIGSFGAERGVKKQMAFKVILFVLVALAPIVIFAMAKSFCDYVDEQEKRKEAAKWSR